MKKSLFKKGRIIIICLCTTLLFSIVCYADSSEEQNSISNLEFGELYPSEFFREANYYEDEEGVLVFERNKPIENENLMRYTNDTTEYVSDTVCIFDMTETEKEALIDYVESVKEESASPRGGGNNEKYDWDSSGGCKAFSEVTYVTTKSNDIEFVEITKVTGGFVGGSGTSGNVIGSGVVVASQDVTIGQTGKPEGKLRRTQSATHNLSTSLRNWTRYPGDWYPVQVNLPGTQVGATYYVELRRGISSSTWNINLVNNVVDNGMPIW